MDGIRFMCMFVDQGALKGVCVCVCVCVGECLHGSGACLLCLCLCVCVCVCMCVYVCVFAFENNAPGLFSSRFGQKFGFASFHACL
jgi:hypothetical protein